MLVIQNIKTLMQNCSLFNFEHFCQSMYNTSQEKQREYSYCLESPFFKNLYTSWFACLQFSRNNLILLGNRQVAHFWLGEQITSKHSSPPEIFCQRLRTTYYIMLGSSWRCCSVIAAQLISKLFVYKTLFDLWIHNC